MKEVAEPKSATAHIQKTAPGPPKAIAVATPAILPTPTRPASDIISDWKEEDRKSTRLNSSHAAISLIRVPYTTLFRSVLWRILVLLFVDLRQRTLNERGSRA